MTAAPDTIPYAPGPGRAGRPRLVALRRYGRGLRTPRGLTGLALIVVVVAVALAAPLLSSYGPLAQGTPALAGPGPGHPLGTDELGRDILARMLHGTRLDLFVALLAVPLAAVTGTLLGLAGAVAAPLGEFFQRVFDVLLGFPAIVLGIAIAVSWGAGTRSVIAAIVLASTPLFGRQARAVLHEHRDRDHVLAARTAGVSGARIMVRHILPYVADAVLVTLGVGVSQAVFIEGGLSVVGLGVQPPTPSLGAMLNTGITYLDQAPLYVLGPIAVLVLLVLGSLLVSDALNAAVLRR